MAKTKYIESTVSYTTVTAFKYPDEFGYWEVHFDGQNISLDADVASALIDVLKEIQKEASK